MTDWLTAQTAPFDRAALARVLRDCLLRRDRASRRGIAIVADALADLSPAARMALAARVERGPAR